ncbi:MAG: hypothetical protein N4A45_02885 [Flavobacteriales bacterium]|nr:hypothetical protein [Flavobacteriales bacterium]
MGAIWYVYKKYERKYRSIGAIPYVEYHAISKKSQLHRSHTVCRISYDIEKNSSIGAIRYVDKKYEE